MKRIYLLLALYSFVISAPFAQEIMVTTDTLDAKAAKTKYNYQTIDQYDQRFLLKLGVRDGFHYTREFGLSAFPFDLFAFEYRLTRLLSIEGSYIFPVNQNSAVSFKLRHFLKGGRIADNLSGKYFALEYANYMYKLESFSEIVSLHFGRQIKKSQFGYADMRVYTGYQFGPFINNLSLGLNATVGAAWGPIGKRSSTGLSSEQKVSSHREHLLITLQNPSVFIDLSNNIQYYYVGSTIEKEFLLKGLTASLGLWGSHSNRKENNDNFIRNTRFSISTSVRKYFGPLKKPNADNPVHAFAGFYVGAGLASLYSYEDIEFSILDDARDEVRQGFSEAVPYLSIGYRERMGKRYFFNISASYSFQHTITSIPEHTRGDGIFSVRTVLGLNWGK
ncbi:MAG: hypothetical protein R8G66_30145 [Cytophagales bacterium]|nr:hypothetical protein [Cytophagales bacterium]